MPRLRTLAVLLALSAALPLHAQTTSADPAPAPEPQTRPPAPSTPLSAPTEQPVTAQILIPAFDNTISSTISLQTSAEPIAADIKAGLFASPEHPNLQVVPLVTVDPATRNGIGWTVPIKLTGLIPFGSSTVPIFYQNKKVDTLHILKSGLHIDPPSTAQSPGDPLLLVVENPSSFHYTSVRARLRFKDKDVCTFSVERFPGQPAKPSPNTPRQTKKSSANDLEVCNDITNWTEFEVPRYAGISLRALPLPAEWFSAPDGYSHALAQKGTLTLRFAGDPANPDSLQEQVLPLEINFQPGTVGRSLGYLRVACWLLLGALFSLVLRIAIPNYRRSRSIRDQLEVIRKTTRGISEEVDSMLRVQLRVENLSLGTLARSVLVISPGFSEIALRVETAMSTLSRRIDYVRRLDAALSRRHLLIADELAQPTRIAAIDRSLNTASEELKSDQFREQDWVFIQQALEAADKILGIPSEEDKSTFETVLIQRWKSIANQYGFTPEEGWTNIPDSLMPMDICFPSPDALCPKATIPTGTTDTTAATEVDATQWIKTAGTVRADLQLTALELIREFQFLAPARASDHWSEAMNTLIPWLTTPAFENLNNARLLLRELSEGISPADIVAALQNGEAHIELDPQVVGSGERVHLAVRFWQQEWNSAASRRQIVCEWRFKAFEGNRQSGTPELKKQQSDSSTQKDPQPAKKQDPSETLFYREKGWEVYHYFEKARGRSPLEVLFYFKGKLVMSAQDPTQPLVYPYVFDLQSQKKSKIYWEQTKRVVFESLELGAALLVPLCALAVSTADKGSSSQWWQLVGLGFGSDTIRNVLSATSDSKNVKKP